MHLTFTLNGHPTTVNVDPTTPLLWVLRDTLSLPGTKYSCGAGLCGACTVHLDGKALRSCSLSVSAAAGRSITTIEGLSQPRLHALQQAWIEEDVPQCGYCQPGQIMAAAAMLTQHPNPTDETIDQQITNLCRCGTYNRIRRAIHRAADALHPTPTQNPKAQP